MKSKILIIEDDENLAQDIGLMLADVAETEIVSDGEEGYYVASEMPYDLIISDLMLPNMDANTIVKKLRQDDSKVPILILTAKTSLDDKINGFDSGADDYLTKPFHREELIARVVALLRRSGIESEAQELRVNDLVVNLENHTITAGDQSISLVGKEFDLLVYFVQSKNVIITKEQIFDRIWGLGSMTSTNVVNIYINNLRRKLEQIDQGDIIKTLRNVGFILETNE